MTAGARVGAATLVAVMLVAACASRQPKPVDFSDAIHVYQAKDYPQVRLAWTRHEQVIRDIGTIIEVWATLKSWDFRQAYVEYYADLYGLSDPEERALRESQLQISKDVFEFHVVAQSTNYKWNDLDRKDSPWKITLVDGTGAELSPMSIEVARLPELYETTFFPARTDFSKTYVVRFRRTPADGEGGQFGGAASGRLDLRVAGPLGRLDLVWSAQ